MALSPRTRELVGLTLVVLLVVAVATLAHLATLAKLTLGNAAEEGRLLSRQLLHQAAYVLQTAGPAGQAAFSRDTSLRALLDGLIGYSRVVVYGAIVDAHGRTLVHSDPSLQGRTLPDRPLLDDVLAEDMPQLATMLLGPPQTYEVPPPARPRAPPSGAWRGGGSPSLVRQTRRDALLRSLAFGAGALALAIALGLGAGRVLLGYLRRIARRVERLARGDVGVELGPSDDMGRLAEHMKGLGERIQATTRRASDAGPDGAARLQSAVVLLDATGAVAYANGAAERLFGHTLGGRPFHDVLPPGHPLAGLVLGLRDGSVAPRHDTVVLPEDAGEAREWAVSGYPLHGDGDARG